MRIAYLTGCYPRASDSFIRTEVEQLRLLGHEVHTFSVRRADLSHMVSEEVINEYKNTQYLLDSIPKLFGAFFKTCLLSPVRMFQAAKVAWKTCSPGIKAIVWQLAYLVESSLLASHLKKLKIDHLHNHIGESSATVAMLSSILSGVPFSQTIHGPAIFFHPERWALGEKIARTSFTRCISYFCKSQCMTFSPPASWDKLHVIHCGIDKAFLEQKQEIQLEGFRLVSIGEMVPKKGQLLLLEAAKRLVVEGIPIELILIGDGPLRESIEKKIEELDLVNHIKLTGWIGESEVREHILSSRALVMASFAEGIPMVIMEALSLKRPVISPLIAGIPELVQNRISGYLYPPGSIEDLTHAMKTVLLAPEKDLLAMGKKGATRVREEFNAEIESKKLADLFSKKGVKC